MEFQQREEYSQRQLRDFQQREENSQRQLVELQRQLREIGQQLTNCRGQVSELQLSLSTAQETINQLRNQETRDWVILGTKFKSQRNTLEGEDGELSMRERIVAVL